MNMNKAFKDAMSMMMAGPEMYEAICDFLHGYCEEPEEEFRARMSDLAYKFRIIKNKAEGK